MHEVHPLTAPQCLIRDGPELWEMVFGKEEKPAEETEKTYSV